MSVPHGLRLACLQARTAFCLILLWLVMGGSLCAAQSAAAASSPQAMNLAKQGLTVLDWGIVISYVAGLIVLGWVCSRQAAAGRDYFVVNKAVNPWIAGVSLFTSLLSTVTYLSFPGEMIGKGPVILAWLLGFPLAYAVVAYVLIPAYMKHQVTSAYELLEARLGLPIRLLGATLFILLRLLWMSVVTFIGATAMVTVIGIPPEQQAIWAIGLSLITGIATITYTSLGGLKAVMIADVMQSILLLSGTLLVIGTVTWGLGGFSWIPHGWHSGWDVQPVLPFDSTTRATLLGTIIFSAVWNTCTAGGDQLSVQRFMSTHSVSAARRAYGISLLAASLIIVLLSFVGLALMGFYQAHVDLLPQGLNLKTDADRIFPYYIAHQLPIGVTGLIVAALLAAQMSGLDSGLNALTSVLLTDWIDRVGIRFSSEHRRAWAMRGLTFAIGLFVLTCSLLMAQIKSNFLELIQRTANLFTPSIFALFVFALFIPRANSAGVLVGAVCGLTTAVLVAFSDSLFDYPISFQWIGVSSLLVNLTTGTLASHIFSLRSCKAEASTA
ncbi:sodium:solute symporter family transporter [Planctomicrobium sp. SH664]|uniref:sodium:solute symporter family transporter n=1 Tax=Planctomicrobium sp. SH664 TaxID=3448125 RepID=UPI003F5BB2C2